MAPFRRRDSDSRLNSTTTGGYDNSDIWQYFENNPENFGNNEVFDSSQWSNALADFGIDSSSGPQPGFEAVTPNHDTLPTLDASNDFLEFEAVKYSNVNQEWDTAAPSVEPQDFLASQPPSHCDPTVLHMGGNFSQVAAEFSGRPSLFQLQPDSSVLSPVANGGGSQSTTAVSLAGTNRSHLSFSPQELDILASIADGTSQFSLVQPPSPGAVIQDTFDALQVPLGTGASLSSSGSSGRASRSQTTVDSETRLLPIRSKLQGNAGISKPRSKELKAKGAHLNLSFKLGMFSCFSAIDQEAKPRSMNAVHTAEIAAIRARGACFRCRMWRKKCDMNMPCQNCKNEKGRCIDPTKLISQPCFHLDLQDCAFFRNKSALWPKPLRLDMRWVTTSPVLLSVRYSSLDIEAPIITLKCCNFVETDGDIVHRKWGLLDYQVRRIPSYCAFDTQDITVQLDSLIDEYTDHYFGVMLREPWNIPGVRPATVPDIVIKTLEVAMKYKASSDIVRTALHIWTGSRLCAAQRTLLVDQTLGMDRITVEDAPDFGHIPIPPMLDYQLDTMKILWMESKMKVMLRDLWRILMRRNKKDWFEVFLAVFLMLNNLEIVYEAQRTYVFQHESEAYGPWGTKIGKFSRPMLEHWEWTANHLIFVFHYQLRRATFSAAPLFSADFASAAIAAANLGEDDRLYVEMLTGFNPDLAELEAASAVASAQQPTPCIPQLHWCSKLLSDPASA